MPSLNKPIMLIAVLGAVILITALWWRWVSIDQFINQDDTRYSEQRILRFNIDVSNRSNSLVDGAELNVFMPIAETENQQLKIMTSNVDSQTDSSSSKTKFSLGRIAPLGRKIVSVTAVVGVSLVSNESRLKSKKHYLVAEPYIEVNNPKVIDLASKLEAESMAESVSNIYDWVAKELVYKGYLNDDRGALYALESKNGDSSEFMFLTLALARALNIPARGVGGFIVSRNSVIQAADYHNWSEVYIDGAWQIVDPQNKNLFNNPDQYIAHRIISPIDAQQKKEHNSHSFFQTNNNSSLIVNF